MFSKFKDRIFDFFVINYRFIIIFVGLAMTVAVGIASRLLFADVLATGISSPDSMADSMVKFDDSATISVNKHLTSGACIEVVSTADHEVLRFEKSAVLFIEKDMTDGALKHVVAVDDNGIAGIQGPGPVMKQIGVLGVEKHVAPGTCIGTVAVHDTNNIVSGLEETGPQGNIRFQEDARLVVEGSLTNDPKLVVAAVDGKPSDIVIQTPIQLK